MRTIYFDCFAGAAGDMIIGALLNFFPSHDVLKDGLKKLPSFGEDEYELIIERGIKNGISGINFGVALKGEDHGHHRHDHEHDHRHDHRHDHEHEHHQHAHEHDHHRHDHENEHHHHVHRGLAEIERMIAESTLPDRVCRESLRAFSMLAEAEAAVHGTTPDKVHFHEVGAVDSIIDIVGTFILVDALGWPRVLCSPINVGSGTVKCAHGVLPVPAPATERILRGMPVFSSGAPMERTTPTGALLIKALADGFCAVPPGRITAGGFGLGDRTSEDMPNVLRALLMETGREDSGGLIHEQLALLECNIDDMNPQDFEPVTEHLFREGALDVWTEPIYMKKGRPAVRFCCLAEPEKSAALTTIILRETSSQGVRALHADRMRLRWELGTASTSLGELRVKTAFIGAEELRKTPEYEDLKRLAAQHGISVPEARRRAMKEI